MRSVVSGFKRDDSVRGRHIQARSAVDDDVIELTLAAPGGFVDEVLNGVQQAGVDAACDFCFQAGVRVSESEVRGHAKHVFVIGCAHNLAQRHTRRAWCCLIQNVGDAGFLRAGIVDAQALADIALAVHVDNQNLVAQL